MTDAELQVIAKGFAPVIRELVAQEVASVLGRLSALEQRAPVPGRDGRDGLSGPPGERGPSGKDGVDGLHGKDGRDGIDGNDGAPGPEGQKGLDGANGQDGRDGIHGKDGAPGPQGEKGLDGRDGVNLEASDFASMQFDPETRTLSLTFTRGDKSVTQSCKARGLTFYQDDYVEGKQYEHGDTVRWGGHIYYAKRDTTAKPGLPTDESRAWVLMVRRGSEGKQGKTGPMGPQGLRGPQGERGPERW